MGQSLYERLTAPVTGVGPGHFPEGIEWEPALDKWAKDLVQVPLIKRTCVAICVCDNDLIVAENNTAPAQAELRDLFAFVGKTRGTPLQRIIRLDQTGFMGAAAMGVAAPVNPGIVPKADVHAEMRILDYLHQTVPAAATKKPVYIGISLPCCAKCYTTLTTYNASAAGVVEVGFAGHHDSYDAHWSLPSGPLKPVVTAGLAMPYRVLKHAVHRS